MLLPIGNGFSTWYTICRFGCCVCVVCSPLPPGTASVTAVVLAEVLLSVLLVLRTAMVTFETDDLVVTSDCIVVTLVVISMYGIAEIKEQDCFIICLRDIGQIVTLCLSAHYPLTNYMGYLVQSCQ